MPDLLDPKNDYVLKRLFAGAPALPLALINAVRRHAPPLTSLEVRNPDIAPDDLAGRSIALDLLGQDATGTWLDLHLQVRQFGAWSARSTWFLARLLGAQAVPGETFRALRPAVGIQLLDFDLFADPEQRAQALWCFGMRDAEHPTVMLGQELELNIVELPKADRFGLAPDPLAAWVAFFRHWQDAERLSQFTEAPVRTAYEQLVTLSQEPEARRLAAEREQVLRAERGLLRDARDEGHAEGLAMGREEGRAQGREAAMQEAALNLIRLTSLDNAAIAAATGLGIETVGALRHGPE